VLKKLGKPPPAIKPVGQVLCMFFGRTPTEKIDDPDSGKKVLNWWKETILLLSDTQITDKLINFDKESIGEKLVKDI
jgi:dynein heavy chain